MYGFEVLLAARELAAPVAPNLSAAALLPRPGGVDIDVRIRTIIVRGAGAAERVVELSLGVALLMQLHMRTQALLRTERPALALGVWARWWVHSAHVVLKSSPRRVVRRVGGGAGRLGRYARWMNTSVTFVCIAHCFNDTNLVLCREVTTFMYF